MSRSRSRSPLKENTTGKFEEKMDANDRCDVLLIGKLPTNWKLDKIQDYIHDISKSPRIFNSITHIIELKEIQGPKHLFKTGEVLVKFKNALFCRQAYEVWRISCEEGDMYVRFDLDNVYEQKKYFKIPFPIKYSTNDRPKSQMNNKHTYSNNQQKSFQSNNSNNYETYGLSLQYLNSLKITLPLGTKLFVSNIHPNVDLENIYEVFGLAGRVVSAKLIKKDQYDPPKYCATVEYDHPVEAVQAISMFHNQILHSWTLKVHMDTKPVSDIPKGLSGIGPGLGPNGTPLRGVRNYIELQPLKQLLNTGIGPKEDTNNSNNMSAIQQDMPKFIPMASPAVGFQAPTIPVPVQSQTPMPVQHPFGTPMMNQFDVSPMQVLQNLSQQNPVNIQQAVNTLLQNSMGACFGQNTNTGNTKWQNITQPNFSATDNTTNYGYNQKLSNSGPSNYDDGYTREPKKSHQDEEKFNSESSDMVVISNLPRSITLQALKSKMQDVGVLKLAEMTGQGRAIIRFAYTQDAARCLKLFDRSKVDGQTIEVRYL